MWRFGRRDNGADVRHDVAMKGPLAMLLAVGASALITTTQASLCRADPGLDASFLDALTKAGITIKDGAGAVKAGKVACGMMAQGRPEIDVVDLVSKQNPGLDTTRAAQFTAIATSAYCPQYLQHPTATGGVTTTAPSNG